MTAPATSRLIDACDPRVTAFRTDAFALADDLDWLDRLRGLRAPVGVVLHAARILEVLARQAVAAARLASPRDGLNEYLRALKDYDLLPKQTYRLLDRLRDLGNKARHVLRPIYLADAEQGYAILLRALQWYFCEFPRGPLLKTVSIHNQPLDALLPAGRRGRWPCWSRPTSTAPASCPNSIWNIGFVRCCCRRCWRRCWRNGCWTAAGRRRRRWC